MIVNRYWLPDLVLGSGPTLSTVTRPNGSSNAGMGFKGAVEIFWLGLCGKIYKYSETSFLSVGHQKWFKILSWVILTPKCPAMGLSWAMLMTSLWYTLGTTIWRTICHTSFAGASGGLHFLISTPSCLYEKHTGTSSASCRVKALSQRSLGSGSFSCSSSNLLWLKDQCHYLHYACAQSLEFVLENLFPLKMKDDLVHPTLSWMTPLNPD